LGALSESPYLARGRGTVGLWGLALALAGGGGGGRGGGGGGGGGRGRGGGGGGGGGDVVDVVSVTGGRDDAAVETPNV
jgi:hypothetical protein